MVVIILEKVTASLRGELSRWLIEAQTGVFVGHVSGMVRDKLWEKCSRSAAGGGVLQVWSTNNEQRFQMRMYGRTSRRIIDVEGIQLVQIPHDLQKLAKGSTIKRRLKKLQNTPT